MTKGFRPVTRSGAVHSVHAADNNFFAFNCVFVLKIAVHVSRALIQ